MTQITGCGSSDPNNSNNPSNKQIVDKFNDFLKMFPSEDLTFLYDKDGSVSSIDGGYIEGGRGLGTEDKGTWTISSYIKTKEDESPIATFGISLKFNKNTKKATGNLIFRKGEIDNKYPIYYDEEGLHLLNEDIPDNIKEGFSKFKMMYEFIELDREYLDSLEVTKIMYNGNSPIFDASYKLNKDDENIAKIKELYPNLIIDENNCALELYGRGIPWNSQGRLSLEIVLDKERNTYFTSAMSFGKSKNLDDVTQGGE
ncbi:Csa1 family protein [uncultured Clostridium sp.]|jgi:hypothetical protein|uniref:Csa1 family protein n=1 Tax=uncultured Clostridium sp. TaxID=59620 RepID=UPI00261FDC92|nr:Csa1 family protein [uncultured Clostridium sp.]